MLLVVWDIHRFEFFVDAAAGFVCCEDALAWGHQFLCGYFDFLHILSFFVSFFNAVIVVGDITFECAKI